MGTADLAEPDLQLGAGCLVDQLAGQTMADVCGLGPLLDPAKVRRTLQSLMRWNFQQDMSAHFNHLRTFALGDEAALVMATCPKGRRPKRAFPYYNEVMTGFEYTAAVHMLYGGMTEEGLRVIGAIRARYDGLKRRPFDEAECGHHYARAMASWAAVPALRGFHSSAVTKMLEFASSPTPCRWFWSSGSAWGTVGQTPGDDGAKVTLSVTKGSLTLQALTLKGTGMLTLPEPQRLPAGSVQEFTITAQGM